MPYGVIPQNNAKREFLSLKPGVPVLFQLLDEAPQITWTRSFRTSDGINLTIKSDKSWNLWKIPAMDKKYRARLSFRFNALQIITSVTCPKCGAQYNTMTAVPERCPVDGADLSKVTPVTTHKVVLVDKGVRFMGKLNQVLDQALATKEITDPMKAVYVVVSSGQGNQTDYQVFVRTDIPVVEGTFEKFSLSYGDYTEEEVEDMLRGVPYAEIKKRREGGSGDAALDDAHATADLGDLVLGELD